MQIAIISDTHLPKGARRLPEDRILREIADSIRNHLRSYDLIIRYGGDEFLCALSDVTMTEAAERFSLVNADLAAAHKTSVSVGVAELEPHDTLEDLVKRADDAMYKRRAARQRLAQP